MDEGLEIIASNKTFTPIENYLIEEIFPLLSKREIVLLLIILRQTEGFHRKAFETNLTQLADFSKIAICSIQKTLQSLCDRHLIEIKTIHRYKIKILFDRKKVKKAFFENL